MLTVKITIQEGNRVEAPPPPVTPPSQEVRPVKTFCSLCSKEGFISSLFSLQFTLCPLCKGKKYTLAPVKAKNDLAGVVAYLREAGVLNPYLAIAYAMTCSLGLYCDDAWEAVKAALTLSL